MSDMSDEEPVDLTKTVAPKSDQLNADDLIGGPRTITITAVKGRSSPDQPVAVHYDGDDGKPYLPCKSMRRLLIMVWGGNGGDYVGRKLRLYLDPDVQFGGIKVGGIRISHMSHMERDLDLSLTVKRAKRARYTVRKLDDEKRAERPLATQADLDAALAVVSMAESADALTKAAAKLRRANWPREYGQQIKRAIEAKKAELNG